VQVCSLLENGIALAAKNRQGNCPWQPTAKKNPSRIESQGNSISLAAKDHFLGSSNALPS